MKYVLLVCNCNNSNWRSTLQDCLAEWGNLKVVRDINARDSLQRNNFDLVIIDADCIVGEFHLIKEARLLIPFTPIIVVTSSRDWRHARDAFRSGATDYIGQSTNKYDLISYIRSIFNVPPQER